MKAKKRKNLCEEEDGFNELSGLPIFKRVGSENFPGK